MLKQKDESTARSLYSNKESFLSLNTFDEADSDPKGSRLASS